MTSALGLGARVVCVFALLAAVLWVLRRTDALGARHRTAPLQVLSTTRLGKAATLSVVRVHDEEHVLAVTGAGVTVVSSRPRPEEAPVAAEPAAAPGTPSAAQFLRAGWRVVRSRPVATTEVADDEVTAALVAACTPAEPAGTPGSPDFAGDLAAALAAHLTPRRTRREVRPPHARPARRRPLRTAEDGAA